MNDVMARQKVLKKINELNSSAFYRTKEYKRAKEASDAIINYQKDHKEQLILNQQQFNKYNKIQEAGIKKGEEIYKQFQDRYASETLKALGYDDSKIGRQYLKNLGIV